jgi:branched-chain amino acid transport system ATP-binding protein
MKASINKTFAIMKQFKILSLLGVLHFLLSEPSNAQVLNTGMVEQMDSTGNEKVTFSGFVDVYYRYDLNEPDAGDILLDGTSIISMAPRQIARMGVARSFQIPQLYQSLSVQDNLLAAIAAQQSTLSFWRPARNPDSLTSACEILGRFDLLAHADRLVSELPGGVRKLLDIAMALTRQPMVLLLDEPTSGVSADEKFPMMDTVMRALEGSRTTVLFVEHDMDIVARYSERVIAFYSGRVIADDKPEQALAMPDVKRYVTGEMISVTDHA